MNNPSSKIKKRSILRKSGKVEMCDLPPCLQSTLAPYSLTSSLQIETLLREIIGDIRTNGELLEQLGDLEQEIERIQMEIVEIKDHYEFVSEKEQGIGSISIEDNAKNIEIQESRQQEMISEGAGYDLKLKLLPHLRCVLSRSLSVSSGELLGIQPSRINRYSIAEQTQYIYQNDVH